MQLKHGVTTVRDSYGALLPLIAGPRPHHTRRGRRSAHARRRQHRRLGRPVLGVVQRDQGAGPDAVPGAVQRRHHAGRGRGTDGLDARRTARRDQQVSRQGPRLPEVRRQQPLEFPDVHRLLAGSAEGARRGSAQAQPDRGDTLDQRRKPAAVAGSGCRSRPASGSDRRSRDARFAGAVVRQEQGDRLDAGEHDHRLGLDARGEAAHRGAEEARGSGEGRRREAARAPTPNAAPAPARSRCRSRCGG